MAHPSADSETFKITDATSYDSVADQFDRFTEMLSGPLADRMISLAELTATHQVLDVGTGTGLVAFRAAHQVGPGGTVLGIDLSDGMLEAATAKAVRAGWSDQVKFRRMDAEALQVEDGSFDRVLSLFALLHFPNPLTAVREMYRVLRPGGRLVVAVGSSSPLFSWAGLVHRFKRLPEILSIWQGKQLTAPGFLNHLTKQHLPESFAAEETHLAGQGLNRTQSMVQLIRSGGFEQVRSDWQGRQVVLDTPEEFWDIQRTISSLARKRLSAAPGEKVERLRAEFLETCHTAQARGGRLVYPVAAFYVTARRPSSK